MRILHLTTYENLGGAAKAVQRLSRGLNEAGLDSKIFYQFADHFQDASFLSKVTAKSRRKLDLLWLKLYKNREPLPFSPAVVPRDLNQLEANWQPDLIHCHWINHGFTSIESIGKINKPMVWTFHDSWPFTGGCHIPLSCTRYRENCGACPELGSKSKSDLSALILKRKKTAWRDLKFEIVCPSHWLADAARSSSLLNTANISVIPNALDLEIFRPQLNRKLRQRLNISDQKKVILVGAMENTRDFNKGFHLFIAALKELKKLNMPQKEIHIITFGGDSAENNSLEGFTTTHLGTLTGEDALAEAYEAADVFVCPSLLENLPYTVIEAMALGTPVVAFRTGGLPDLISHQANGFLAAPFEPASLAAGIFWILGSHPRVDLRRAARAFVESHLSLPLVAARYQKLYAQMISRS